MSLMRTKFPASTDKGDLVCHVDHQDMWKYWVTWGTRAVAVKVCHECLYGKYLHKASVLVEALERDIESEVWD